MSVEVHNIHNRFKLYWSEYEHKDLYNVCYAICKELDVKKPNCIQWVKDNWQTVCNFLVQWEGYKLK